MDHYTKEEMRMHISRSVKLVEIHRQSYESVVNGGVLIDHFISLRHGLRLIGLFFDITENEKLIVAISKMLSHVKQKLCSLSHLSKDESSVMKLDHEYSDLRGKMLTAIIKAGTNKDHLIFPRRSRCYFHKKTSLLLCEIIEELASLDCKAHQIRPLIDIRKMLSLLEPFFEYENDLWGNSFAEHEKERRFLSTVDSVMERVPCFLYLSAVGKMDDQMVISLKMISSDLIIEETQIMDMYLSLDVDCTELEFHISMSLRLLEWNKRCYLGTELGEALEDHFTSIEHGLQYIVKILKVSKNEDLNLRVKHLIANMKQKLYSLPYSQNNENLKVNLEQAYGELREEMKNVVINPRTNDFDTLFQKVLESYECLLLEETMELTLFKLTHSSKADQIAPAMKEIIEFGKKLRSLKPLFDHPKTEFHSLFRFTMKGIKVNLALTTFLDKATCLLYLSLVAKLNEDMFVSLRKNFSLLIEETEIKKMSLGIMFEDDFDISLSLMKRHQESHIHTINEDVLEDHIISLKYGIEFLKWFFNIYNSNEDFKLCIILLAENIKQKLEFITYKQKDESLNMDVNGVFAGCREEMKNVIISERDKKYDSLLPETNLYDFQSEKIMKAYLRRNYDFLVEKITTLGTSNCKADRIAPLMKELQHLRKRLKIFKPLGIYICGIAGWRDKEKIFRTLLTFLHKAAFLIYLTFVGTLDSKMVLSVKSSISIAVKETDNVQEIYTNILNQFFFEGHYEVKELYLLENLMILLKNSDEQLNENNRKLAKVLRDIHSFLLPLPPNVILRKLHLLINVLHHSIPIVYLCYFELTEVDISAEYNCVLDLIEHIKSEAMEMKLYYFPKVEDLGFLEFLLGYLKDLMENQEILLKMEIDELHIEVSCLLSFGESRNQEELDKNPWKDIMTLAYQAEYIIDLYLVSSPRDLGLISSLSTIIRRLHNLRQDNLRYLPAQDDETSILRYRDDDGISGLHEETQNIMDNLLRGEKTLNVVAITGVAGVGKTTLALTLYNCVSTAHHFDIRAKSVVSQSYQLRALLVSLLDQVTASDKVSNMNDQDLPDHFCKSLKGRRYLIVLDDIWDTTLWKYLKRYLPDDRNGSRILITTRNWKVADQITSKVNELHGLSEENSWKLFRKKFRIKWLPPNLLDITEEIVKSCKGLPLSIVIVAGILSGVESSEEKWNQIAQNVISAVLGNPQGECEAILKLSYNYLPNRLKYCFLYLGSFHEDKEISVDLLILLWIGEGFFQDTEIHTAEEVAKKYVEDLIGKRLVIPAKKRSGGGVKTFFLHDLVRDFCLCKAKETHFFTFLGDAEINIPLALQDCRRIIFSGSDYLARTRVDFSYHNVRSMIIHGKLDTHEIKKRIESCGMVLLRVLEVDEGCSELFKIDNDCGIDLEDISSLVHLRYLAFHLGPWIERDSVLTSSIRKLQNLRILILIQRSGGYIVPDFIWEMVKLRHIHINEALFEVDSNRLQNSSVLLENLKSLSVARVSYGDSNWLSKLSGLQRLHCLFTIDDPEVEVESRMLSFNGALISLKVKNTTGRVQRFIRTCQLPRSLRKLTLTYFYLESDDISEIGQTLTDLEVFKIYSCGVPSVYKWNAEYENFPKLKVLKLKDVKISKWIVSEDSFPKLEQLWLEKCDCLYEIPFEFGDLLHLRFISVKDCLPSVDNSAREIEKVQHKENQNTKMRVHISKKKIR